MRFNPQLTGKILESLSSVLPIGAIVLLLSLSVAPLTPGALVLFFLGTLLLIVGLGAFTLGVDLSMTPMGSGMGEALGRMKRPWLVVPAVFALGTVVTIAEPDLQVLSAQVPAIPTTLLLWTVAVGVGVFLTLSQLRSRYHVPLSWILTVLYGAIFLLALLAAPQEYIPVSFDSGGVTTGPITVPFLMALGVGLAGVRSDSNSVSDSFGLVALCSVGPILSVLLLGIFYPSSGAEYTPAALTEIVTTRDAAHAFLAAFPVYAKEVFTALAPICAIFLIFELLTRRFQKRQLLRIASGLVYAYAGLVVFLTGVNVGFLPAGSLLGKTIAGSAHPWLLVPVGAVMGYFIVAAEPAVHVLIRQVEEVSMGAISQRAMRRGLSLGVGVSVALAMLRVLTGIPLMYFLLPGYAVSLALTFFVPQMFTGVAFDAGGVASGPMTATFLLPFAMGACEALGGNWMTDAFGLVALVAMTPLVTIQLLGLAGRVRRRMASDALRAELTRTADDILYFGEEGAA